ncbi:hypothetical protein F5Y08DRAFT_349240 [Xylaria arbuscula]|nr:hypothetical protein F5Y08DRAFT_349240 [Xylaria arbuscula]
MKLLAIAPAFLAAFAAAEQVWPLEQYESSYPTFTTKEPIILTWEEGYFNPYIGHDYTPDTFNVSLAAYNNTPTGHFINWYGQEVPTYEVSTVVLIDDKASTHGTNYTVLKPELIKGWKGKGYWYWFGIDWTGTNGVGESFGTQNFFMTDE